MPHLHFRGVKVSVRLHIAAEVPLVDITAVGVLSGDFMEGEVDFVEAGVREGAAKPQLLFPINYPDQYSGPFGLENLA